MAIADLTSMPIPAIERVELRHKLRASALTQLLTAASARGIVRESTALLETLQRLERLLPSALGKQAAVPQARSFAVERPDVIVGRSVRGIEWDAQDGELVRLVVLVLTPASMGVDSHLDRVQYYAHLVRQQRTRQRLIEGDDDAARAILIAAAEGR
jgi:mannitol/fructose-specific phosphotransferase system IIA component (Ntr-type)